MVINKVRMKVKTSLSRGANGQRITASSDSRGEEVVHLERNIKTPGDRDILLGRGRTSWSHTGNQQFRAFVGLYLKKYTEAHNRTEKTRTVHLIYDEIIRGGGRFLKLDSSTNTWYQVGKSIAREKIAHALRDAIGLRIKLTPDAEISKERKPTVASKGNGHAERDQKTKGESAAPAPQSVEGTQAHRLFVEEPLPNDTVSCEEVVSCESATLSTNPSVAKSASAGSEKQRERKTKPDDKATRAAKPDRQWREPKIRPAAASTSFLKRANPNPSTFQVADVDTIGSESGQDDKNSLQLLVSSMLDELENSKETTRERHDFYPHDTSQSTIDDELSTGVSAMSLESRRSGRSGRSGRSARSDKKMSHSAAIFELSEEFSVFKSSVCSSSTAASADYYGGGGGLNAAQGGFADRNREKEPTPAPPLFDDESFSHVECETSVAGSMDWAKGTVTEGLSEIGSLDDFSLTSNRTPHSKSSNHRNQAPCPDASQGSSEKSSETAREWRETLKALRGS